MKAQRSLFLNSYWKQEALSFQFALGPVSDVAGSMCSRSPSCRGREARIPHRHACPLWGLSADLAAGEGPTEAAGPTVCGLAFMAAARGSQAAEQGQMGFLE